MNKTAKITVALAVICFVIISCQPNYDFDILIKGKVYSKSTNEPVKNIKVMTKWNCFAITDENGEFSFYSPRSSEYYYSVFPPVMPSDSVDNQQSMQKTSIVERSDFYVYFLDIAENKLLKDTALFVKEFRKHEVIIEMEMSNLNF